MPQCPVFPAAKWSVTTAFRTSAVRWLAASGLWLLAGLPALAAEEYSSADEAFTIGAAYYNSKNFAKSQAPFEAALKLAPDDAFRLKVHEALIPAYRLLPDIDKMVTSVEFLIDHSEQAAKQSNLRTMLVGFTHQRGKTDDLVKRYEARLKDNPKDRTALFILSEIYVRVKRDPQRSAQLIEQLSQLDNAAGKPLNVFESAKLAQEYVKSKKFKEGAQLYEQIAPLDEKLAAWNWKEAAAAWAKAGDKQKALAAARRSESAPPEARSELLVYFWQNGLGDIFLDAGEPKSAIPHYEQALTSTKIEGYLKSTQKRLEEARSKAGK
jgi:tetratricopeptide (TPR) repeat protein